MIAAGNVAQSMRKGDFPASLTICYLAGAPLFALARITSAPLICSTKLTLSDAASPPPALSLRRFTPKKPTGKAAREGRDNNGSQALASLEHDAFFGYRLIYYHINLNNFNMQITLSKALSKVPFSFYRAA